MLLTGIFCMVLVGLTWTVFGYVMGKAPKQGLQVAPLMFYSALLALAVSGGTGLATGLPETTSFGLIIAFGPLFLCGFLNYFQLTCMSKAMQHGPNGIIWSVMQSGFIFPFFMGILCFQVPLTFTRSLGLLSILVSLALFGLGKSTHSEGPWKLLTFAAFLITGLSQSCSNLPSYFPEADGVSSIWRTSAFAAGLAVSVLCCRGLCGRGFAGELRDHGRRLLVWGYCILLEGFELVGSFFLLYPGMNMLTKVNAGSIAYPIMVSSCIIGFEAFSLLVLREKRTPVQWLALLLCLTGVVAICL